MSNNRNSIFINFEGIDNSGKTTLIKDIRKVFVKEFPVHITNELRTDVGRLVLKKLKKNNISVYEKVLLFAADRVVRIEKDLKKIINASYLIISDRWIYSAIAYRSAEDVSLKDYVISVNKIFLKPDINFYIDITPEESARRGEINDKNNYTKLLLGKVRNEYKKLIKEHDFIFIDGMKDYNEIKDEVISLIRKTIAAKPLKKVKPHSSKKYGG